MGCLYLHGIGDGGRLPLGGMAYREKGVGMTTKLTLACAAMMGLAGCANTTERSTAPGAPFAITGPANAEAPDGVIAAVPMPSAPLDEDATLSRIVFASCAHQNEDQSIWDLIAGEKPDLTLYIGDNVYGDVRSNDPALPELKTAYMRLAQSEPFSRARQAAPMLTTWDDHDYGLNDAGGSYEHKEKAEALFEYVWDVKDERAERPGIYNSWIIGGEDGRRVQLIMLDTRFFRSDLKRTDDYGARGKERYLPDADPSKTMLGDAQWAWLADELQKPADLRLLVSSVQVISEGHGWEAWKMLPAERDRLYALIDESDANGVVILSGDRHSGAFYRKDGVSDYPLFEATSSSLNLPARGFQRPGEEPYMEPGPNRLGDMIIDENYGVIDIDWDKGNISFMLKGADGAAIISEQISIGALQ